MEENKTIEEFKLFKYNEVIKVDEKIYKVLEYQQGLFSQNRIQIMENAPELIVERSKTEETYSILKSQKKRKKFEV